MSLQCITLKWGTLKGWDVAEDNAAAMDLLKRYHELGVCMSVAAQNDSDDQKGILCELVSLPEMNVYLDWDGKYVTQQEAVAYIKTYRREVIA